MVLVVIMKGDEFITHLIHRDVFGLAIVDICRSLPWNLMRISVCHVFRASQDIREVQSGS